jgi:hypothetical protein
MKNSGRSSGSPYLPTPSRSIKEQWQRMSAALSAQCGTGLQLRGQLRTWLFDNITGFPFNPNFDNWETKICVAKIGLFAIDATQEFND